MSDMGSPALRLTVAGRSGRAPALRRPIVAVTSGDPMGARRCLLQLPEGRLGLQPVDQELTALKSGLPVRGGSRDQYDALAGEQPAEAVDDQARLQRPA